MKRTMKNDPLLPLIGEYYQLVKDAYRFHGVDHELEQEIYNKAGLLALEIQALRFRN
jgi:hypothetical protein